MHFLNTTGSENIAEGIGTLNSNITGNGNIALGSLAGQNVNTANNVVCIGADGNNIDNGCYNGNIFNATSSGGTAVYIQAAG
jgi:hypothetical protein